MSEELLNFLLFLITILLFIGFLYWVFRILSRPADKKIIVNFGGKNRAGQENNTKSFLSWKDCLWFLVPIGILILIILSVLYIPAEPYDPNYDSRIENCGPGGTTC